MRESYREIIKGAEAAVRGIKDRDLKREAFGILLLRMLADSDNGDRHPIGEKSRSIRANILARKKSDGSRLKKLDRPGRKGGGIATTAVQKLIGSGYFRAGRDAAVVMRELSKKHMPLEQSQLRMILLRFSRSGKLKRRIKMKGEKVTYIYSVR